MSVGTFADFALPQRSHAAAIAEAATVPLRFLVRRWVAGSPAPSPGIRWTTARCRARPRGASGHKPRPAVSGPGGGTRAQRSVADMFFAPTPAHRVEASTDTRNMAEQKALERAGFQREGVARGAQWRSGNWHDLMTYARLRSD